LSDPVDPVTSEDHPRPAWGWVTTQTWSRRIVRVFSILSVGLLLLGVAGWWLTTRILSDEGFADVMAKAVRQPAVSRYIAEQVTLKLAPTSKVITAARPVATTVVAEALGTQAVGNTVRKVVAGVHRHFFALGNNQSQVGLSAENAAATLRATLEAIDPNLARRVPNGVLTIATNITQNKSIDLAARAGRLIRWLYVPVGLLGALLMFLTFTKARDPVHSLRFGGFSLAIGGGLFIGLGLATPLFAALAGDKESGRGKAVAAFVHVLLGRLEGAGWALALLGLLLAFAPGRDGSGVAVRFGRAQAGIVQWWRLRRAKLTVGLVIIFVGIGLLTVPKKLLVYIGFLAALLVVYCGLLLVLRGTGIIETSAGTARLRRRQLGAVAAGIVVSIALTTTATAAVVHVVKPSTKADPRQDGCNGFIELCFQPLNQILWPGSHNAMSSAAYNFFTAEHIGSITEQLDDGAQALLIDAYNGYQDHGLVRTNFTGKVNRQQITDELGGDALRQLDRVGALTGAADTSGKKNDVYLCHLYCEVGAVKATKVFSEVNSYLNTHLTDVVILDVEDYVTPADLEKALKQGHLWDRHYHLDLSKPMPTLLDLVNPPPGQDQEQRRVIVTSENQANKAPWLVGSYDWMQETPFTFDSTAQFNCNPNRGAATNPMLLVNHWLRAPGPPDPVEAAATNAQDELTSRLEQCVNKRRRLPNILAVDFFGIGDTNTVCDTFNAAVATLTGVAGTETSAIERFRQDPATTDAALEQLDNLPKLPEISVAQAQKMLGPIVRTLERPATTLEISELKGDNVTAGRFSRLHVQILPSPSPSPSPTSG
jgi:hypothetical protein